MKPNNIKLKIGSSGVTTVKFHPKIEHLIMSTEDGRVRIYDYTTEDPTEIFRKKWHKSIYALALSNVGESIFSSSAEGCLKIHDYETEKETWSCDGAHIDPITKVIYQTEKLLISGDESGTVKFWDIRQQDELESISLCEDVKSLSSVNDIFVDKNRRHIFVGMDDGILQTINGRTRKIEVESEMVGSSIKSVFTMRDQQKLLTASDDGVVSLFNWKQFGNLSDRYRLLKNEDLELETAIKINEHVIAAGTNTGVIKALSILPNATLSDIGSIVMKKGYEECGDCLTMDVSSNGSLIAASCPFSNVITFFSTEKTIAESLQEQNDRKNKKRKIDVKEEFRKIKNKKKKEEDEFFAELCENNSSKQNNESVITDNTDDGNECDSDEEYFSEEEVDIADDDEEEDDDDSE